MSAVCGVLLAWRGPVGTKLLELASQAGTAPISGLSVNEAWASARDVLLSFDSFVGSFALVATLIAALVPVALARRKNGSTSVSLPSEPAATWERLLPRLVAGLLCGLLMVHLALELRRGLGLTPILSLLSASAKSWLVHWLACGLVLCLAGAAEALLFGRAIARSLRLAPFEARRDERAAGTRRPRAAAARVDLRDKS